MIPGFERKNHHYSSWLSHMHKDGSISTGQSTYVPQRVALVQYLPKPKPLMREPLRELAEVLAVLLSPCILVYSPLEPRRVASSTLYTRTFFPYSSTWRGNSALLQFRGVKKRCVSADCRKKHPQISLSRGVSRRVAYCPAAYDYPATLKIEMKCRREGLRFRWKMSTIPLHFNPKIFCGQQHSVCWVLSRLYALTCDWLGVWTFDVSWLVVGLRFSWSGVRPPPDLIDNSVFSTLLLGGVETSSLLDLKGVCSANTRRSADTMLMDNNKRKSESVSFLHPAPTVESSTTPLERVSGRTKER